MIDSVAWCDTLRDVRRRITNAAIREAIPHPPTAIDQDNRSLYTVVHHSVCGPLKKLKSVVRYLNIVKQAMQDGRTDMIWVPRTKQQSDKLTKAEVSPTGNWRWAEYVLGSSAAVQKYRKLAEDMKTRRQAQGTIIRYQLEEDVKAQSAIEQDYPASEQSMEQDEEYDRGHGPTEEQESEELERKTVAWENRRRNAKVVFDREEVLGRQYEYFQEGDTHVK